MNIDISPNSGAKYTFDIGDLGGSTVATVTHTHTPKSITVLSLTSTTNKILLEVASGTGGKDTVELTILYSNGDTEIRNIEFHVKAMYL